jgi:glycosyltransferase involved in cell wall biosynthesis
MTVQDNTGVIVLVAAHEEGKRIGATLAALHGAFPEAAVWVADDGSADGTASTAKAAGAQVVRGETRAGKGEAMTGAARAALTTTAADDVVLLCDGDLGASAAQLPALVAAVRRGEAGLAVAAFSQRLGGGFGLAVRFARWAIRRRCGLETVAPLSGQRALRAGALPRLLPFAPGYGMEVGMTIDAACAGMRIREIELDLAHRAGGRTPAGFAHRARQLLDCVRAYVARR